MPQVQNLRPDFIFCLLLKENFILRTSTPFWRFSSMFLHTNWLIFFTLDMEFFYLFSNLLLFLVILKSFQKCILNHEFSNIYIQILLGNWKLKLQFDISTYHLDSFQNLRLKILSGFLTWMEFFRYDTCHFWDQIVCSILKFQTSHHPGGGGAAPSPTPCRGRVTACSPETKSWRRHRSMTLLNKLIKIY